MGSKVADAPPKPESLRGLACSPSVCSCFLGGVGRLSGMVLAVVILQAISSGVNLMRVDPFFVTAMWGAMILALIAIKHFSGRWRRLARPADVIKAVDGKRRLPPSAG